MRTSQLPERGFCSHLRLAPLGESRTIFDGKQVETGLGYLRAGLKEPGNVKARINA